MNKERLISITLKYLLLILIALSLMNCSNSSIDTSAPAVVNETTKVIACPQGSDISVTTGYVYYEIEGATAEQLRDQMNQFGRKDEYGNHWDAYTEWFITWFYPYAQNADGCSTGEIEVEVEVNFEFPEWNIPANASRDLISQWDDFLRALQKHEDGHREIAIDAACEILQDINSLPSYPSCLKLDEAVETTTEQILDLYREREKDYDRDTEHGKSQGVSFP